MKEQRRWVHQFLVTLHADQTMDGQRGPIKTNYWPVVRLDVF